MRFPNQMCAARPMPYASCGQAGFTSVSSMTRL
jgi:hypothetical protein